MNDLFTPDDYQSVLRFEGFVFNQLDSFALAFALKGLGRGHTNAFHCMKPSLGLRLTPFLLKQVLHAEECFQKVIPEWCPEAHK
jgi:hypothetical protein